MTDYRISLALVLILLLQSSVEAADVYALFNYPEKSEIQLIYSTQGLTRPLGKLFVAHRATAFHLDEFNYFRLTFMQQSDAFKPMWRSLCRQVFDGLPIVADRGKRGHAQYQDQRDLLLPGQSGRPVFRSRGAPFSPGPGFMVSPPSTGQEIVAGETEVLADINWYEIPNASWYQTWFKSTSAECVSYMIFYDCWQQRSTLLFDSVWGGAPVTKSDEILLGNCEDYRMLRAKVDGAMEITADAPIPAIELSLSVRVVSCLGLNHYSGQSETLVYSWYNDAPGTLCAGMQQLDPQVIFESRHKQARFPMSLSENRLLVMGTDLLHSWLRSQGQSEADSECTFCVTVPVSSNAHALFVYSAVNNSLYRFLFDNTGEPNLNSLKTISPVFVPAAMTGDSEGNLIIGGFSVWPPAMTDEEDLLMSVEAIDLLPVAAGAKVIKGSILMAQKYYFNLYRSGPDNIEPLWFGRFNVGKHLYRCEFEVQKQLQDLTNDVRELLNLARQPGNSLSQPKRLELQQQPEQFVLPAQVFIAVSN